LKYDTRSGASFEGINLEIKNIKDFDITKQKADIDLSVFNSIIRLSIGQRDLGFLVVGRKNNIFSENEKNMLVSM